MKATTDPIFTAYAKSAPLLDLEFYIRYAGNHLADYTYQPLTLAIMQEMYELRDRLMLPKAGTTASQKRAVWALISRFKSSIPQWFGNAGSSSSIDICDESEAA